MHCSTSRSRISRSGRTRRSRRSSHGLLRSTPEIPRTTPRRSGVRRSCEDSQGPAAVSAVNDSTMTWFNKGSLLPVEVTFTEMTPGEKSLRDRRPRPRSSGQGGGCGVGFDLDYPRQRQEGCRGDGREAVARTEGRHAEVRGTRQGRRGARIPERHHRRAPTRQECAVPGQHPGGERDRLSLHGRRTDGRRARNGKGSGQRPDPSSLCVRSASRSSDASRTEGMRIGRIWRIWRIVGTGERDSPPRPQMHFWVGIDALSRQAERSASSARSA